MFRKPSRPFSDRSRAANRDGPSWGQVVMRLSLIQTELKKLAIVLQPRAREIVSYAVRILGLVR